MSAPPHLPQSVAVTVPAKSPKCLKIRTELNTIDASGTQNAYITASNWVGLHQSDSHHWKWDSDPKEAHYYRAATLGKLVSMAKQAGVPEANDWTVVDGNTASVVIPINLQFNLGTSGRTYNDWYDNDTKGARTWENRGSICTQPLTHRVHHWSVGCCTACRATDWHEEACER